MGDVLAGMKNATRNDSTRERVGPMELFVAFGTIGLCGFGGILPWARRVLVDKNGWLTDQQFTELLGFAQILPGANGTHLAVMFGVRCCGWRGAACAVTGLLIPPLAILMGLALLYRWYGALPQIHSALKGMAAVAAGLTIESAVRLARAQPRRAHTFLFYCLPFVAITVLNLPLLWIMAALIPASIGCELWIARHAQRLEHGRPRK